MNLFLLSQILAGTAIIFDFISFQLKKRTHIVLCLSMSVIFIAAHFLLLEKWTAAILMGVAAIRYIVSYFTTSIKTMMLFVLISVISSALTFQGYLSILSCIGAVFQTIATFNSDDRKLRLLMIVGTSFWITHNVFADSPVAVLMESLFLGSNLLGYYRFYIRKKKNNPGL